MEELENVPLASDILPLLKLEAMNKGLNVYVFDKEDFGALFEVKNEKLGLAILARDEDNAKINLRNLRHCWLIQLDTNDGYN